MARQRVQVPDEFFHLAGRLPDRIVAERCGTSVHTVSRWRRLCGIQPTIRSGAGAPRVDGGAAETITVSLSPVLKRQVVARARAERTSVSAWVRQLVEREVTP